MERNKEAEDIPLETTTSLGTNHTRRRGNRATPPTKTTRGSRRRRKRRGNKTPLPVLPKDLQN
eukprot:8469461-Prorocentrum_lima.AAC.1